MISRAQPTSCPIFRAMLIYLLLLVSLGSIVLVMPGAQGRQRASSSPTASTPKKKVITIWKVGGIPKQGGLRNTSAPPRLPPDLQPAVPQGEFGEPYLGAFDTQQPNPAQGRVVIQPPPGTQRSRGRVQAGRGADPEARAKELGYKPQMKRVRAAGFAKAFFRAYTKNQEPDILTVDNIGSIREITTPPGGAGGTAMGERVRMELVQVTQPVTGLRRPSGWEFLIRTSSNYEAARSLALQPPECNESQPIPPAPEKLQTVAGSAARACLEDWGLLSAFEDPGRLHTDSAVVEELFPILPITPAEIHTDIVGELRVSGTKVCGSWGNDHLAFVQTVSTYQATRALGQLALLLVFRNQHGQWQLLAASTDRISNTRFVNEVPELAALLHQHAKQWNPPMPAKLLSPEDGQWPKTASGQPAGDFVWQPSPSPDVVAEIAEFAYCDDARLFLILFSGKHPETEKISARMLWSGSGDLWQWRVWSISKSGAVSFSEVRSFPN